MRTSFLIWPFLLSCSHQYIINSRTCPTKMARFGVGEEFEISKRLVTPYSTEKKLEVNIKDLLKQNSIQCSDIGEFSITMKNTWWDSFFNMLPLIDSKTIVIKGKKVSHDGKEAEPRMGI